MGHPLDITAACAGGAEQSPAFLRLQAVERWNGKSPLVGSAGANNSGAALLLALGPAEKRATL